MSPPRPAPATAAAEGVAGHPSSQESGSQASSTSSTSDGDASPGDKLQKPARRTRDHGGWWPAFWKARYPRPLPAAGLQLPILGCLRVAKEPWVRPLPTWPIFCFQSPCNPRRRGRHYSDGIQRQPCIDSANRAARGRAVDHALLDEGNPLHVRSARCWKVSHLES